MEPMRRNASTVVVLAGSAPGEVLAAVGQSMNVTLIRPEDPADGDSDTIAAATAALQRAGRTASPYALVGSSCPTTTWCSPRIPVPVPVAVPGLVAVPEPSPVAVPVVVATSAGRISISVRYVRPGRTGWRSSPRRSPRPRPRVSCRRWGRCGTAPGGRPGRRDRAGPRVLPGQPGRTEPASIARDTAVRRCLFARPLPQSCMICGS